MSPATFLWALVSFYTAVTAHVPFLTRAKEDPLKFSLFRRLLYKRRSRNSNLKDAVINTHSLRQSDLTKTLTTTANHSVAGDCAPRPLPPVSECQSMIFTGSSRRWTELSEGIEMVSRWLSWRWWGDEGDELNDNVSFSVITRKEMNTRDTNM